MRQLPIPAPSATNSVKQRLLWPRLRGNGLALALILAALLLLVYAVRAPRSLAPPLGDAAWDRSFDSVELDTTGEPFRWMRARAALPLPRLSTAPHLLILELESVRPDRQPVAIRVVQGAQLDFAVAPGRRSYTLLLPGTLTPTPDEVVLAADTFRPAGDRRSLSVVVRGAASAPAGPGLPWWLPTSAGMLAQVALLAVLLRSLGVRERVVPAAALATLLLFVLGPAAYGPSAMLLAWGMAGVLAGTVALRRLSHGVPYRDLALQPWARHDYLLAGGLALGAVVVRVVLIPHQVPLLNGDDYLTGSYAANILLRGWHALYFGHHTGALSAYLVLPAMALGGVNALSLMVLPIGLSALLTLAVYGLGTDLAGRWGGVTAALWLLAPSATALWWTLKPQPGYLEAVTFAALALWGTVRLLWGQHSRRDEILLMGGIGLTAVLAFWAGMVVASILLVCGLLALIRWRRLPQLPLAGYGLALFAGLLWLLPTAIYVVQRPGDNPLWWVVGRDTEGLPPGQALVGLIQQVTPLALGVSRPWPMAPVAPWAAWALVGLTAVGLLVGLWMAIGTSRAALIPVALTGAVVALFCFSSFNTLLSDVRYVLPIYLALPLFAALLVTEARRVLGPRVAGGLLATIVVLNLWSGLGGMLSIPPSTERPEARVAQLLAEQGVTHVHSSYWIAQPLMVESGGRIVSSAVLGPSRVDYDERVRDEALAAPPERVALIVATGTGFEQALDAYLAEQGVSCRRQVERGLTLYLACSPFPDMDDLRRALPAGRF